MLLPGLEFLYIMNIVSLLQPGYLFFYCFAPEERTIILHLVTILMAAYN